MKKKSNRTYKLRKDSSSDTPLIQILGENKKEVENIKSFLTIAREKYGIGEKGFIKLLVEYDEISVPLSIFKNSLAPLEAITFYLKKVLDYRLHSIAKLLNRDDRTIWLTYKNSLRKNVVLKTESDFFVPFSIFGNRKLSVLENLVSYLKEKRSLSLNEISKQLDRDNRTIWTVYNRSKNKLGLK